MSNNRLWGERFASDAGLRSARKTISSVIPGKNDLQCPGSSDDQPAMCDVFANIEMNVSSRIISPQPSRAISNWINSRTGLGIRRPLDDTQNPGRYHRLQVAESVEDDSFSSYDSFLAGKEWPYEDRSQVGGILRPSPPPRPPPAPSSPPYPTPRLLCTRPPRPRSSPYTLLLTQTQPPFFFPPTLFLPGTTTTMPDIPALCGTSDTTLITTVTAFKMMRKTR